MITFFKKEKICFMGDLLFEKTDPNSTTATEGVTTPANPEHLRNTLIEYADKDIDIYISGHGNLCTKKELRENAEFFDEYFIKKK